MIRTGLALLVLVLVHLLPAPAGAQATRPATAPAKKHSIAGVYKAGERLLMVRRFQLQVIVDDQPVSIDGAGEVKKLGGPYHRELKAAAAFDIAIAAGRGERPGEKQVHMTFRRIRARVEGTDGSKAIDTAGPETAILPGEYPLLRRLAALRGISVKAQLDAAGEITKIDGAGKYAERFVKGAFPSARPQEDHVTSFTRSFSRSFRLLLAEPFAYLPPAPVAVGESWAVSRDLTQHELWAQPGWYVKESVKCTLAGVTSTPAGRVATIKLSGAWTIPRPYRFVESRLPKTGRVEINLDTGEILRHHAEVNGDLPLHRAFIHGGRKVPVEKFPRTGTQAFKYTVDLKLSPDKAPAKAAPASPAS